MRVARIHLESIVIPVTSESALLSVDLHLTNDRMKPTLCTGFPISGFPRSLADGEPLKRTSESSSFSQLHIALTLSASPASPSPEHPKVSNKRQSLRERNRNVHGRASHSSAGPQAMG